MTSRVLNGVAAMLVLGLASVLQGAEPAPGDRGLAYRLYRLHADSSDRAEVVFQGNRARITYDQGEEGDDISRLLRGEFELWLDGGARRLAVDRATQVYYDRVHYLARSPKGANEPTLRALQLYVPFTVESVSNVRVNVRIDPKRADATGLSIVPVVVEVSYRLNVSLLGTKIPATVQATAAFDVTDSLPVSSLPFKHGLVSLTTGYEAVDRAIAERLSATPAATGISVRTVVQARRQVESSPPTEEKLEERLENFHDVTVAPGTFDLPAGLRFQEPVVVGPAKK